MALVSPTIHGLKEIIKICEYYACEFDIMFNPKKSKLMCYNISSDTKPIIKLCNQLVQAVDNEVYLEYLCSKYKYSYNDWYRIDVNSMLNKSCVEYTNHDYAICQTVLKLCICVTEYPIVNI